MKIVTTKKTKIWSDSFLKISQSLHPSLKCFGTLFFSTARQTLHLAPATPSVFLKRKPSTFHSLQEWGYFHRSAADVPAWTQSPAEIMGQGLSPCPPGTCHLTQTGLACTAHLPQTLERAGNHLQGLQRVGGSVGLGGGGRRGGGGAAEMEQEIWNVSAAPHLCRSTSLCYITFSMAPCHRRNGPGLSPLNESETEKKKKKKPICKGHKLPDEWPPFHFRIFRLAHLVTRTWCLRYNYCPSRWNDCGPKTFSSLRKKTWEFFFPWQIQLIAKF